MNIDPLYDSKINPFPILLRYFRKKAGLTQQDLSSALCISRSGYANYEEGRHLPSLDQTIELSKILKHDLLYAYTVSSRYMQEAAQPDMVREGSPYLSAIEPGFSTAELIEIYSSLSDSDRMLVFTFVKKLYEKNNNNIIADKIEGCTEDSTENEAEKGTDKSDDSAIFDANDKPETIMEDDTNENRKA